MGERIPNKYVKLFEVRLLHHYWLDDGNTVFDLISDPNKQKRILDEYNLNTVLRVAPVASTELALKQYGCLCISHQSGIFVISSGKKAIPDNTTFEFSLRVCDANFFNYTALTLPPQVIHELLYEKQNTILRYKENVPVWSNITGTSRGTGSEKNLFLSKEFKAIQPDNAIESLILKSGGLWQLTSDQPSATTRKIGSPVAKLPVFANQADIPELTAPEGLSGVPSHGIQLTDELPNDLFGLIRLSAKRPTDPDFSFIDNDGLAKADYPVYQLRFKSRLTLRRYLDKRTSTLLSEETSAMPLTFFGNAGTKQKPDTKLVRIEKTGGKIARIVSEIFI
jgi:hypothetical protein